jgi:hypothetical protein
VRDQLKPSMTPASLGPRNHDSNREEDEPVRGERHRSDCSGQCVARALVDPVTLAESFDLNDGPAHHPTIHVKICPAKMTSEIMPYLRAPCGGEAAE